MCNECYMRLSPFDNPTQDMYYKSGVPSPFTCYYLQYQHTENQSNVMDVIWGYLPLTIQYRTCIRSRDSFPLSLVIVYNISTPGTRLMWWMLYEVISLWQSKTGHVLEVGIPSPFTCYCLQYQYAGNQTNVMNVIWGYLPLTIKHRTCIRSRSSFPFHLLLFTISVRREPD